MSEFEFSHLLVALGLLLFLALALGQILETLKLPRVIGEISAGLVLGPSLLGELSPGTYQYIFRAFDGQNQALSIFHHFGLILLMFTAGFRISFSLDKRDRGLALRLIIGGLGLPFVFGFVASSWLPNQSTPNSLAFSLIIAIAAAVTSIPVLSKIFMDLGIGSGHFARLTLTASAIQDLILWSVLSVAVAFQQGKVVDHFGIAAEVIVTIGFAFFVLFLAPTLVRILGRRVMTYSPGGSLHGYVLLVCLVLVTGAHILQVNTVFGALLSGMVIARFKSSLIDSVRRSITDISVWFFVPIYFALVGLQIDLRTHLNVGLFFAFFLASSSVKVASVIIATRVAGLGWIHALDYALVMNARGGPGIVLASLAFAANIIDEDLFVVLVLTSIITSLTAGVWLRLRLDRDAVRFR